jgi:hypothetical protein
MALGWRKEYFRYKTYFLDIVNLYKQKEDLRMFLEILLSLATVSFFGIFALKPTLFTITQLLKDIKTKEETVAKMDTKIANLETAQSILDQNTAKLALVNSAIFTAPKPEVFSRQAEGLAKKNSVSLLGLTLGEATLVGKATPPKASKELKSLPAEAFEITFSLSVSGTYGGLFSFLKDLEGSRLPFWIDSFTVSTAKVKDQKLLTLVVSGRIPYLGNYEKD